MLNFLWRRRQHIYSKEGILAGFQDALLVQTPGSAHARRLAAWPTYVLSSTFGDLRRKNPWRIRYEIGNISQLSCRDTINVQR